MHIKKENILGIKVLNTDYEELIKKIEIDIKENKQRMIIAINPEKIMKANQDNKLKTLLNKVDYPIVDGVGIIYASKLKRGSIKNRITGIDCMTTICDKTRDIKAKIFLYGAKPGVALETKKRLEEKYPGINIVGVIDGYEKDNKVIIDNINKSKADILFVALGSPKQEYWMQENMKNLHVKIFQGVGGSFDVICGNIKRAPRWMQKIGLEWFYRLVKEPKRIWRQLKLLKFLFLIATSKNKVGENNE